MNLCLGIVTTLRNAEAVLDSFVTYHLAVGFDRLLLFFDDPADPAADAARAYPQVTVFRNDAALHRRRAASTLFAAPYASSEVMARQILNLEVAIGHARTHGIDWLLHVDHDELFYAVGESVREHFAALEARGVAAVRYPNLEAVPEQLDVGDYFRTVTLFKTPDAARRLQALDEPRRRRLRALPQLPPGVFHFYANGKSAARVRDGLRPDGVHRFRLPPGQVYAEAPGDPVILHYPCCGFDAFRAKFATLAHTYPGGRETWWGEDVTDRVGPFYRDARALLERDDRAAARAFYARRYVLSDADAVRALLDAGLCRRITAPAAVLAREEGRMP